MGKAKQYKKYDGIRSKKDEDNMKKNMDLTQGSILKGFCLFALPLFLGSLFQLLYGTVDLLFVGNFLGKTDAAAVGASSILVACLIGLFTGISTGTGVVTSQYWGTGKQEKVILCMENALILGGVGGIALSGIGMALSRQALIWLNTPEKIMPHALVYIRIYLLSIPAMIFYNMASGIMRAMGDSRTPFLVLASGGFLNVLMDAFFIVVLRWGVSGAAFATMVSQSFTGVVLLIQLFRQNGLLKKQWTADGKTLGRILATGFPLGIQSMILTLSNLFVQYYINGFGEEAVAAFAVYFKIENLIYLPIMAFGQAMVTFTGQNVGAEKNDRIRKGAVQCNVFSVAVIACISAVVLLFGRQLLGMFCKEEEVIAEGLKIIHVSFPFYFIYAILEVTGGIVRGTGKTMQSMTIVIIHLCVVRVLLLGILAGHFHTVQAVALVYPVTWGLASLSFAGYYYLLYYRNPMQDYNCLSAMQSMVKKNDHA